MIDPAPIKDQFQYKEGDTPNQGRMLILPSWATWLTKLVKAFKAVSGESVLSADFTLNAANGTYQDTGLSVNLPSKGTYRICSDVRGQIAFSVGANGFITAKLYNSTDSADVANSERLIVFGQLVVSIYVSTAPLSIDIPVNGPKTIKLYAKRDGATTWTTSLIASDANGRTNLGYERIGD